MGAIREDVLDSLVQVFVAEAIVRCSGFTKERIHLRQGDDFGVLVTDIRQNPVENFRFDVIDLRGSEN